MQQPHFKQLDPKHQYPVGAVVPFPVETPIPEGYIEVPRDHWIANAMFGLDSVRFSYAHLYDQGMILVYRGDALPEIPNELSGISIGKKPPRNFSTGPSGHGDNDFMMHESSSGSLHPGVWESCPTCGPSPQT